MGILVVFRSLLLQRYRSLFLVPSLIKWGCSEITALSAFSTNLTKKYGGFNITKPQEDGKKGRE
jgi:hypothetical protein